MTMTAKIEIVDYVAPAKAPHEYAPHIKALIEGGKDKVAYATFDTQEDAEAFVKAMQTAAREQNVSARRRGIEEIDGKFRAGVSVTDKITRNRPATPEVEAEVTETAAAPEVATKPSPKAGK